MDDDLRKAAQAVWDEYTGMRDYREFRALHAALKADTPNDHVPEFARGRSSESDGWWHWNMLSGTMYTIPTVLLTYIRGLEIRLDEVGEALAQHDVLLAEREHQSEDMEKRLLKLEADDE